MRLILVLAGLIMSVIIGLCGFGYLAVNAQEAPGLPMVAPPAPVVPGAESKTETKPEEQKQPPSDVNQTAPPENKSHQSERQAAAQKYYDQAMEALSANDAVKSEALFSQCIEQAPDFASAFNQRGTLRQNAGRYPAAIEDFTRYIELRPDETAGYVNRGNALSDSGDQQAAFKDFDKARSINESDAYAWLGIGMTYLRSGDPKGSIEYTDYATKLDPNFHWAWNNRACAYLAIGQKEKALQDENRAIELAPEFGHHYFKRGLILQALGKPAEMQKDFDKARQLGFDVDGQLKVARATEDDVFTQGIRAMDARDYKQAQQLFEQAVKEAEAKGETGAGYEMKLNDLAACYNYTHDYDKAEASYKKLIAAKKIASEPIDGPAYYGLGKCYYDEGKYAQAEPLFRQSMDAFDKQIGKNHPLIKTYLVVWANCLRKLTRNKEADAVEARTKLMPDIPGINVWPK